MFFLDVFDIKALEHFFQVKNSFVLRYRGPHFCKHK